MAGARGVSVRSRGRAEEGQKKGKEGKKEEGNLNGQGEARRRLWC